MNTAIELTIVQLHHLANAFSHPWPYGYASGDAPSAALICADVDEAGAGAAPKGQQIAWARDRDGGIWALTIWVQQPPTAEEVATHAAYRRELDRAMNPPSQASRVDSNELAVQYE